MQKVCENCKKKYTPSGGQYRTQKYCSISCKRKVAHSRLPYKKGGVPRATSVAVFMKARISDDTAPCHYCGVRLRPKDKWVLDHKIPLAKGGTSTEDNFLLSCFDCNSRKRNMDYDLFIKLIEEERKNG